MASLLFFFLFCFAANTVHGMSAIQKTFHAHLEFAMETKDYPWKDGLKDPRSSDFSTYLSFANSHLLQHCTKMKPRCEVKIQKANFMKNDQNEPIFNLVIEVLTSDWRNYAKNLDHYLINIKEIPVTTIRLSLLWNAPPLIARLLSMLSTTAAPTPSPHQLQVQQYYAAVKAVVGKGLTWDPLLLNKNSELYKKEKMYLEKQLRKHCLGFNSNTSKCSRVFLRKLTFSLNKKKLPVVAMEIQVHTTNWNPYRQNLRTSAEEWEWFIKDMEVTLMNRASPIPVQITIPTQIPTTPAPHSAETTTTTTTGPKTIKAPSSNRLTKFNSQVEIQVGKGFPWHDTLLDEKTAYYKSAKKYMITQLNEHEKELKNRTGLSTSSDLKMITFLKGKNGAPIFNAEVDVRTPNWESFAKSLEHYLNKLTGVVVLETRVTDVHKFDSQVEIRVGKGFPWHDTLLDDKTAYYKSAKMYMIKQLEEHCEKLSRETGESCWTKLNAIAFFKGDNGKPVFNAQVQVRTSEWESYTKSLDNYLNKLPGVVVLATKVADVKEYNAEIEIRVSKGFPWHKTLKNPKSAYFKSAKKYMITQLAHHCENLSESNGHSCWSDLKSISFEKSKTGAPIFKTQVEVHTAQWGAYVRSLNKYLNNLPGVVVLATNITGKATKSKHLKINLDLLLSKKWNNKTVSLDSKTFRDHFAKFHDKILKICKNSAMCTKIVVTSLKGYYGRHH